MRKIDKVIIHCTATPEDRWVNTLDLYKWHVLERGWSDVGYHYFIDLDGEVFNCRPIKRIGAHTKGQNENSIGIAYAGGLDADGLACDTRNLKQKKALKQLLLQIKEEYKDIEFFGHNDFSSKKCPCFNVKTEYKNLGNEKNN